MRKWHDRVKITTTPLFPCYIFVYLSNMEHYYRSRDIDSVLDFVRFGKEVALISEKVINDLRLVVDNGEEVEVIDNKFDSGQQLVITQGSLSGLSCEMISYKNRVKALVRINILNRAVLADIPVLHLVV